MDAEENSGRLLPSGRGAARPVVLDILIVCDMARREQGAQQDEEITEVLRYCGDDGLQKVMEEMEGLVARLNVN